MIFSCDSVDMVKNTDVLIERYYNEFTKFLAQVYSHLFTTPVEQVLHGDNGKEANCDGWLCLALWMIDYLAYVQRLTHGATVHPYS